MATRRLSGMTTSSSVPDNGGDHSGGGGDGGTFIDDVFSTYLYTGTGADQTIRNGIELGGGTLLAGSWCFQGTWEADKVIGSFSGAKTGDYIVGISVGLETVGPAEIKANGNGKGNNNLFLLIKINNFSRISLKVNISGPMHSMIFELILFSII